MAITTPHHLRTGIPRTSRARSGHRTRRTILYVLGGILALALLIVIVVSFFLDEQIRRRVEQSLNANLKGYSAELPGLDFHPIGFSITLEGLTVRQQQHPDPPVMQIPRFDASVQWRELIRLQIVADMLLERPKVYIDRTHFESETKDPVPIEDKGWQEAVESIYPLEINEFRVEDADVTYKDSKKEKPVRLTNLNIIAANIRNIRNADDKYPSEIWATSTVFGSGSLQIDGEANFLEEPYASVAADVVLKDIPLERIKPVSNNVNLLINNGTLGAKGHVEYGPKIGVVDLQDALVQGVDVEYHNTLKSEALQTERIEAVKEGASDLATAPATVARIGRLRVRDTNFAFKDSTTQPNYRLTFDNIDMVLTNLSNQKDAGRATLDMKAMFMGEGPTTLKASFLPIGKTSDFAFNLGIEPTQMTKLNDLLRAFGKFDVAAGTFALYSEVEVHNSQIDGYVKPMFNDMNVYTREQDADKGPLRQFYENVVEGAKNALENRRETVATKTDLSGKIENPETSTLEILLNLIGNAFIRAIVPGFDREAGIEPNPD